MENASKALIIAGAILISILIISFGVIIINNVRKNITDTGAIDDLAVQQYNSKFESYKGKQSGSNARALYQALQTHNRKNSEDVSQQIDCNVITSAVQESAAVTSAATLEATAYESTTAVTLSKLSDIKTGYTYYIS